MMTSLRLGLGNIARSQEAALWIADVPGVVETLCMLMKTDNTAFEYSALGTVKNLSIAPGNKPKLLTAEVIGALSTAMKSPQGPVQYLASSALRSICIEQPSALIQTLVAEHGGLVERLVHLSEQEEQHVHSEALRALVNIVRYGQTPPPAAVLAALPGLIKAGRISPSQPRTCSRTLVGYFDPGSEHPSIVLSGRHPDAFFLC